MNPEEKIIVVIVDDTFHQDTPHGRTITRIAKGLTDFEIEVSAIASLEDARSAYAHLPEVDCVLINWNLGNMQPEIHDDAKHLIREIRLRNEDIPIFLMAEPQRKLLLPSHR